MTAAGDVLVVTGSATEKVAELIVLSAEPVCRVMLLEAAHTSDPPLDPAMVLFQSIIQIDVRPVTDAATQRRADRTRVRVVPVGCHPVRHKASNRPCRAKESLGRLHVTGRAQHRVDQVPVAIDGPIQIAPLALNLEVGLICIPTLPRPTPCAMTPFAQSFAHDGQQLRLPPTDTFVADGEPAQQHDLAEISQRQSVAQPAKHHERDDIARQRRAVQDAVATFVELPPAVLGPEPTIALCCQLRSLGHSRRAASYAMHRNWPHSTEILGKPTPCRRQRQWREG